MINKIKSILSKIADITNKILTKYLDGGMMDFVVFTLAVIGLDFITMSISPVLTAITIAVGVIGLVSIILEHFNFLVIEEEITEEVITA